MQMSRVIFHATQIITNISSDWGSEGYGNQKGAQWRVWGMTQEHYDCESRGHGHHSVSLKDIHWEPVTLLDTFSSCLWVAGIQEEEKGFCPEKIMLSLLSLSPPTPSAHGNVPGPGEGPTWTAFCSFCLGGNCRSSGCGCGCGSCCSSCRKCRTCFNSNSKH